MGESEFFRSVWLIALLLMVLPAALALHGRPRARLQQAAIWVLAGGFLVAFYLVFEWLAGAG